MHAVARVEPSAPTLTKDFAKSIIEQLRIETAVAPIPPNLVPAYLRYFHENVNS